MALTNINETLEIRQVLEKIAPFTLSERGNNLVFSAKPLKKNALFQRITILQELHFLNIRHDSIPLSASIDLSFLVDLIKKDGTVPIENWNDILSDLHLSYEVKNYLRKLPQNEFQELAKYYHEVVDLKRLIPWIEDVFDQSFNIKDDASSELKRIRFQLRSKEKAINQRINSIVNEYRSYLREGHYYLKGGVFALPVIRAFKNQVPGLVVDVSDSEQTVFIHPLSLINLQNEIEELKQNEKAEVQRILFSLSQKMKPSAEDIRKNNELIGFFDYLQALTKYAINTKAHFLMMSEEPIIHLIEARHPLLNPKKVVPNTFLLSATKGKTLILSGPNAGGKTIALKTIGLLVEMFLMGLPVLCEAGSTISYFKNVYGDIGDNQSINLDLSTFSSHLQNLSTILSRADQMSLILLDELGSGTEPRTGEAIAIATLEYLVKKGSFNVISSHFQALKALAFENDQINIGSFSYDVQTNQPKYHYLDGIPGQSYGLELAKQMALPEEVLSRALLYLSNDSPLQDFEEINRKNILLQEDLIAKQKELEAAQLEIVKKEEAFEFESAKLRKQQKDFEADYQEKLEERLEETQAQLDALLKKAYDAPLKPHEVIEVKKELDALKTKIEIKESHNPHKDKLVVGDYVMIKDLQIHGTIKSLKKNKGTIITSDGLTFEVNLNRFEKSEKPKNTAKPQQKTIISPQSVNESINLIGYHIDEAIETLIAFLDTAYGHSLKKVKVIHGFGTGKLKEAIRNYLAKSPYVSSFSDALANDGGGGATIIIFK